MAPKAAIPREKLVALIADMLAKKGPMMAMELERKIAAGTGLEIRGVLVENSVLKEALDLYDDQEEEGRGPSSAASKAPAPKARVSTGSRWTPSAPSASLLAARALQECELAEAFHRKVVIDGGAKLTLLKRPDVLSETTGDHISGTKPLEVVARYVSGKDGRVYLRMREQTGWVSTRSTADLSRVVLSEASADGSSGLEPARCAEPLASRAMQLLPLLADVEAASEQPGSQSAEGAGGAEDEEVDVDEGGEDAQEEGDEPQGEEADVEEAEEPEGDEAEEADAGAEEGQEGEEEEEEEQGEEGTQDGPSHEQANRLRRFRVVIGRCPVLDAPNASELMARSTASLPQKQEFTADAVVFAPAEGRAYLRLRLRGGRRGWVCERARNDLRKLAVVPVTKRKKPLSAKAAKRVAFRGGDTEGRTKLRKEDLMMNKAGKIVSKKQSDAAKKRYNDGIGKWSAAVKRAREELGIQGFAVVKKGTPIYEKAREFYEAQSAQGS